MGFPSIGGLALIFALVGLAGWQFKHNGELAVELKGAKEGMRQLAELRAKDQEALTKFNKRQAALIRERADLSRQIEELKNADTNVADFMRLPVPGELRQRAEAYLNRRAAPGD